MENNTIKKKPYRRIVVITLLILTIVAGYIGYKIYYAKIWGANVVVSGDDNFLLIPTGSDVASVATLLKEKNIVKNINSFLWVADKKNYGAHVYPGRYAIKNGMSNNDLINLLRSGKQSPVQVTFNSIRTMQDLAGKVALYIEADSASLIAYFDTASYFTKQHVTQEQIMTLFIPNTYEFKWNTNAEKFAQRMIKEHDVFWNASRTNALKEIHMNEAEVYTLASIVYSETKMPDEAPRVAGVYMNRLQKNMPLQADPTIIFAIGDFSITRVLNADKLIESKYNTYKYTGLPPGPICMPPVSYIDAVLQYEKNDYLFFCAKEDFSGYSNFAKTLAEHDRNAAKYREALNKKGIYR